MVGVVVPPEIVQLSVVEVAAVFTCSLYVTVMVVGFVRIMD